MHTNGQIKQIVERAKVDGVYGFRQSEFYADGKLYREMTWARGVLEGDAKVYLPNNILQKEVRFRRGLMVSYKGYKDGHVETEITADRRSFVHRGRKITPHWDKYYELLPKRKLIGYSVRGLVDNLLLSRMPEDVVQVMADLNTFADQHTGGAISNANDIVSCGNGRAEIVDDLGLQPEQSGAAISRGSAGLKAPEAGTIMRSNERVAAALTNITSPCTGELSTSPRVGGPSVRDSQIGQAEQVLDQAIASCNNSLPDSSDLVANGPAIGPGAGFISTKFTEAMAAIEAAQTAAVADTSITTAIDIVIVDGTAIEGPSLLTTSSMGFASLTVLTTATAVVTAFGLGWVAGTFINNTFINPAPAADPAPAAEPQKSVRQSASKPRAINNQMRASVGQPNPEGDSRNKCDAMASFKAFCEKTRWIPARCAAFIGLITNCRTDVTRIQVTSHEGDIFDVACPNQGSEQILNDIECKQKGMIGQPAPGESSLCGPKTGINKQLPNERHPGAIDPVRDRATRQ